LIVCVLGGFFWIIFSVVFGIAFMFMSNMPAFNEALILLTGLAMVFGIPAGLVGEVVRWRKIRSAKTYDETQARYCTQCGKEVQRGLSFCGFCGSKL
jgi:hypothetical protein